MEEDNRVAPYKRGVVEAYKQSRISLTLTELIDFSQP